MQGKDQTRTLLKAAHAYLKFMPHRFGALTDGYNMHAMLEPH